MTGTIVVIAAVVVAGAGLATLAFWPELSKRLRGARRTR